MNQPSNQALNTNNFQRIRQNCLNIGSNYPPTVCINLAPVNNQAPHHYNYQARPVSFSNGRPTQSKSIILTEPFNQANPIKSINVDSYPRKGSMQQQIIRFQNVPFQPKLSHSTEKVPQHPNNLNRSHNKASTTKKPVAYSTIFSIQQGQDKTKAQLEELPPYKLLPPPCPKFITKKKDQNNQLHLPLNKLQDSSIRQNKTDRDTPSKPLQLIIPVPSSLKYLQKPTQKIISNSKPQNVQLDSTVNSSISRNNNAKKQLGQVKNDPNESVIIKKFLSPPNFWPLSISPSQQKRQNVLYQHLVVNQQVIKQNETKGENNNEFKKKKNFQFLRNLKKRLTATHSFPSKQFQLSDFQIMDKIGKGSFGDVFVAQQKITGFICVIKKLLKKKLIQNKVEQQLLRQIKIQSFLNHRHLTSLYGFFSDESYIYLILQLMSDGSMMQVKRKRKIPQPQVSSYVRQICLGLKYMHTENVIHRDIKPENIFLHQGYAKIGDFGCSIYTKTLRDTQIGSFAYISPEQLKKQTYNQKIDVWSLGVMTYEMLVGVSPFQQDIIKIARREIGPQLSELKFPNQPGLSAQAKDFVIGMLDMDPNKRIGIQQALRHEFILKYIRQEEAGNQKLDSC